MFAIAGLLLIVALSLIITRVATVILVATGMSRQSARFQARSALSGAGFTTNESETVIQHPMRRKVIAQLMLIGSAGVVAAAGSLIIGFRRGAVGPGAVRLAVLAAGLVALVWVSRNERVDRWLTAWIGRLLRRFTDVEVRDAESLVALTGEYSVMELAINGGDWVADQTLNDCALRDEGIVILGIKRPDGRYLGAPHGDAIVRSDDVLILYGQGDRIAELDDRPTGADGDLAHEAAIRRHLRTRRAEHRDDESRPGDSPAR